MLNIVNLNQFDPSLKIVKLYFFFFSKD